MLDKLLAKDRQQRYSSADEVVDAITSLCAGADLTALAERALHVPGRAEPSVATTVQSSWRRARLFLLAAAIVAFSIWKLSPVAPYLLSSSPRLEASPESSPSAANEQVADRKPYPFPLSWDKNFERSSWNYNATSDVLWLNCEANGLLSFGNSTTNNYAITAMTSFSSWGHAGLFWGFRPTEWRGRPCHAYHVLQWTMADTKGKAFSITHALVFRYDDDGGRVVFPFSREDVEVKDVLHAVRVTVREGQRVRISLDDEELVNMRYEPDPADALEDGSVTGEFGVQCEGGSSRFRNVSLAKLEK